MATVIKGDAELKRKLAKLKDFKDLVPALKAASHHVRGKIAKYPPSSAANRPGGPGSMWYVRGWGSKWMRKDGSIGGRMTSEDLGPSWTRRIERDGLKFIVGNDTSYGPYVQGEKQTRFHAARGWKTTDQVVDEEDATVLDFLKKAVDKILAG